MSARPVVVFAAALVFAGAAFAQPSATALPKDGAAPASAAAERTTGPLAPESATAAEARAGLDRALAFLVAEQNEDGSFASGAIEGVHDIGYAVSSFYDWQFGAHCLAVMALLAADPTEERDAALGRAITWFCETRLPKRGSDWDNDAVWAALYGTIAATRLLDDPRIAGSVVHEPIEARGKEFLAMLVRNQVPSGGWGYYDDPPYSQRPKWATSFSTAVVIPALAWCEEHGWLDDPRVRARAVAYVKRCRLPNGAYEYDLRPIPRPGIGESINTTKGSLGRIQVCNWALHSVGDESVTPEGIRRGLELFFEQHRFLDVARMRPIPHEAFYANAGYFYFFGHYYAARVVERLPAAEREAWHARLRPHVLKTQRADGSMCDFLGQRYLLIADTAFGALALQLGLDDA